MLTHNLAEIVLQDLFGHFSQLLYISLVSPLIPSLPWSSKPLQRGKGRMSKEGHLMLVNSSCESKLSKGYLTKFDTAKTNEHV